MAMFLFGILCFVLVLLPLVAVLVLLLQALVILKFIELLLQKCRAYLLPLCRKDVTAHPPRVTPSLNPPRSEFDTQDHTQLGNRSFSGRVLPGLPTISSDTSDTTSDTISDTDSGIISDYASDNTSDATSGTAGSVLTTDLSPANAEDERSTCPICTEDVMSLDFPITPLTSTCTHPLSDICKSCIETHFETLLANRDVAAMTCPICIAPVSHEDMRRHAAPDVFARYDERTALKAIEQLPGFFWCPSGVCGAGQIHAGGVEAPIVTCTQCRDLFCFVHRQEWHEGMTCREFERAMELEVDRAVETEAGVAARRRDERLNEEEVRRISRRCIGPGCKWRMEKEGGCKHMICERSATGLPLPQSVCLPSIVWPRQQMPV